MRQRSGEEVSHQGDPFWSKTGTYPDVELNDTPHNQHGRVSIAVLDVVDCEVPENGAERGEEAQEEDDDETDFLARVDLELKEDRNRDNGNDDIRDDGNDGVGGKRRPRGETCTEHIGVPRLLHRFASQDQGQGASQVAGEDENDRSPYHYPGFAVVGPLEQPQVADQQGNFEEADAQLVNRSAGKVGSGIGDFALFGTVQ